TRESLKTIEKNLRIAEAKAARRGLPLGAKWQAVRDALDSERLPRRIAGKQLPRTAAVLRYAQTAVARHFRDHGVRLGPAKLAQQAAVFSGTGRLLGRTFVAVDLVGTSFAEWRDLGRYQTGEIGGGYLAFKSGVRASQLTLAYYAAA